MNKHVTALSVRYNETDKMGIVHHSQYIIYFEIARTDFIRHLGMSYQSIEKDGLMMPVLGVTARYHTPARYDDRLLVETSIKAYDSIKMSFNYKILNAKDHRLIAEGSSDHCWTDLNLRPVSIRKKNPRLHTLIMTVWHQE